MLSDVVFDSLSTDYKIICISRCRSSDIFKFRNSHFRCFQQRPMSMILHSVERESKATSDKILTFFAKKCFQPFWITSIFIKSAICNIFRTKKGLKINHSRLIFLFPTNPLYLYLLFSSKKSSNEKNPQRARPSEKRMSHFS